jgi:hypothetical protein
MHKYIVIIAGGGGKGPMVEAEHWKVHDGVLTFYKAATPIQAFAPGAWVTVYTDSPIVRAASDALRQAAQGNG